MRILFLLTAAALLGTSARAQDESPYIFRLGFGGVFSEDSEDAPGGTISFDPGFSVSAAVGRKFALSERTDFVLDAELLYQYWTVDESDLLKIPSAVDDDAKIFALMLNGTLDWSLTSQYGIYFGVGGGYAKEIDYAAWDAGNLSLDDGDGFAAQARVGFSYDLGGSYDFRLGYRYFYAEPIDVTDLVGTDDGEIDIAQHSLEATFRWSL